MPFILWKVTFKTSSFHFDDKFGRTLLISLFCCKYKAVSLIKPDRFPILLENPQKVATHLFNGKIDQLSPDTLTCKKRLDI